MNWACKEWWQFLQRLVALRKQVCDFPFGIEWIPAHCFDDLPEYMITETLASSANTTREHVLNNRAADRFAKSLAHKLAPVHPDMQRCADRAIEQHHAWLVVLHTWLPTCDPATNEELQTASSSQEITIDQCRSRFPAWHWNLSKRHFPWRAKIPYKLKQPARWNHTAADWRTVCAFLRNLAWMVDQDQSFSFTELAAVFHHEGYRLEGDNTVRTFFDVYKYIRESLMYMKKMPECDSFPGTFDTAFPRSCGRVMPQGCIRGAIPFFTDEARLLVARLFAAGAGRTVDSWKLPLADF